MAFENPVETLRAFMRALGMDPAEHVQAITVHVSVDEVAKITVRRVVTKEMMPAVVSAIEAIRPNAIVSEAEAAK